MVIIDKLLKNKNLITHPTLSDKLRDISIGVLLGDASIQKILVKHKKNID